MCGGRHDEEGRVVELREEVLMLLGYSRPGARVGILGRYVRGQLLQDVVLLIQILTQSS
jgi:hypothetical protein